MPSGVTEADIGGLQWSEVSGGGDLTGGAGGVGTYVCPVVETNVTLDLKVQGGPFAGLILGEKKKEVIKPREVRFYQKEGAGNGPWHQKDKPSAGFRADVYYLPADVDFSGIETREKDCKTDKHSGDYDTKFYKEAVHPVGTFSTLNAPGKDGKGSKDSAPDTVWILCDKTTPFADSEFNWPIPWVYKKRGAGDDTEMALFIVNQNGRHNATNLAAVPPVLGGTSTVSKGGLSVTKNVDEATNLDGM
jgi:hypothetical protein